MVEYTLFYFLILDMESSKYCQWSYVFEVVFFIIIYCPILSFVDIKWSCCFESQFRFYVSDTVNASSAESVKEPVIGSSLEVKQDDAGEVLVSIHMLKFWFFFGNDCVCLLGINLLTSHDPCLARNKIPS